MLSYCGKLYTQNYRIKRSLKLLLSGAIAVTTGSFRLGESSLPHLVSSVTCQGSETNLLQCQYSNTVSCETTEDAAVVCQGGLKMCMYIVCMYVYMYVCMYVCIDVCIYVCMYVCMYVHMHARCC